MSPIWGAHSADLIRLQYCFVPYKTFSRYKTLCVIHLVPPKTFFAEPNCLKTARSGPPRMRWKESPQRGVPVRMVRPAGVHGILPFHIICSMSMVSRATAKLMKQHKTRKEARSFAKPCLFSCHYKACRHLQRRFWYSHRDSNPNRQNRNLKSYPLDYGSKRGQGQMPPCGIDFPYLRCKVNYFND